MWQGPAASPLPPHPDVSQHRGGWTVRVQLGEEGPPSSTPPCPFRPPFPLRFCCSEPSPVRKRGDSFVPKHTHTKFECWIWQRLWNKGRLRREIKKKNLQLSGDTTVTRFYCWCDTIWKCSPAKHRFYPPPLPSLSSCSSLNFGWGPVCVTAPVQIEISTKLPRPLYLWAPSPCQLATVWDILQLPLHYGHRDFSPPPPLTCVKLPEWNQTIVIDRKAEETPHLTSTHAESNYTPSASALAPAWGFRRARGERMGGRD